MQQGGVDLVRDKGMHVSIMLLGAPRGGFISGTTPPKKGEGIITGTTPLTKGGGITWSGTTPYIGGRVF